jgi:hypothetical protein
MLNIERAVVRAYYDAVAEHEAARGDIGQPSPLARGLKGREKYKLLAVAEVFGISPSTAASVIDRAETPGWRTMLGRGYNGTTHKALAALRARTQGCRETPLVSPNHFPRTS